MLDDPVTFTSSDPDQAKRITVHASGPSTGPLSGSMQVEYHDGSLFGVGSCAITLRSE